MKRRALEVGTLLLAMFVRLWGLGAQSLWMDEAFSHLFATLPPDTACQAMIVDAVHPPLYYVLLRLWLVVAGQSEFALRFPSVLAGGLTVALLLRSGRRWMDGRIARWAALLLALNPFHIWYSQEARMYAFLGLLALAVLMAFWQALHTGRPRAWAALAGISGLAYVTHYFALYLPLVEFVFLAMTFRRHYRVLGRWTIVQVLAVLPLAAWLVALYTIAGDTFGIGWICRPQPADLLKTLWSFGTAYDGHITALVLALLSVWGGLLVLGAWRGVGARRLLILSLVLPPLVTFLLSLRRPTYVDRFFIGSLPAFLVLAAAGLVRLPRPCRWVLGLALACLSLWGVLRFREDPVYAKEDWRGAAAYVEAHERANDALALRQFQYMVPFRYYYGGVLEPVAVTLNRETMALRDIISDHERLWLLFRGRHEGLHDLAWSEPFVLERDETELAVQDWISNQHATQIVVFSGVTVMLFELGVSP